MTHKDAWLKKKNGNHFLPILSMLSWYWNWDISVGKGNNAKKNKEQISITVCRRGMSFKDQYGPILDSKEGKIRDDGSI